jgi:hypothetical protein
LIALPTGEAGQSLFPPTGVRVWHAAGWTTLRESPCWMRWLD